MSSPAKESSELKAGHAPATKVGGMRVKAPRQHEEKVSKEDAASPWESEGVKQEEQTIIVAGAKTHGDKDFPPAAVKVAHEKPQPSMTKPAPKQQNQVIHQPR